MLIQPNTCNQSRSDPSTAVQYALIGVYGKLLNPPKIPCALSIFTTNIVCVVLSCFVLLTAFKPRLKLMINILMSGMIYS